MRPLPYLCISFVTTKMIVGVGNVCIAEYAFMYPYKRSYLQVRSTLVKFVLSLSLVRVQKS